jgi:hypothetical protein
MNKRFFYLLSILSLLSLTAKSQNFYRISAGINMPNSKTSNYLNLGFNLLYGTDFKLYKNLYLNTELSVAFNNMNEEYNYGLDDYPVLDENPLIKNDLEQLLLPLSEGIDIYLLNTALKINIEYIFLKEHLFSPYLSTGIHINYSVQKDGYWLLNFTESNIFPDREFISNDYSGINLGYNASAGIKYKNIYLEFSYLSLPEIKFGLPNDAVALYFVKFGWFLPFQK